jgi:serine phosphatase RsbU (regulator of sigma subunit)
VGRPHPHCNNSGDIGFCKKEENLLLGFILDVTGHGEKAFQLAQQTKSFVEKNLNTNLEESVEGLHANLKKTVGGVGALLKIEDSGQGELVAIGNVTARIIGSKRDKHLVSMGGLLGQILPNIYPEKFELNIGEYLLLHTDGLVGHTKKDDFMDVIGQSAQIAAETFLERFSKNTDDAFCMVIRRTD